MTDVLKRALRCRPDRKPKDARCLLCESARAAQLACVRRWLFRQDPHWQAMSRLMGQAPAKEAKHA